MAFRLMRPGILGGSTIEHVGSATNTGNNISEWIGSGNAFPLRTSSGAEDGDLVVLVITAGNGASVPTWGGTAFTALHTTGLTYIYYRFLQSGDTDPYVASHTGVSTDWEDFSAVFSVFRGVTAYENGFTSTGTGAGAGGTIDPPSLTAGGRLWVTTLQVRDSTSFLASPPNGYRLSDEARKVGGDSSTTYSAYKIASRPSDDPGDWTGINQSYGSFLPTTESWRASTLAFS